MASLLPFHKSILEAIHDPATSDLLILARGLGLRKVLCTLMQIYDSPQNLVLLVNASQEEEAAIGEELGIMGCRNPGLRIVDYEMGRKERQDLYKRGGLISVTSRILVVDLLQKDIPIELITGILVLHAEKVSATSLEAFIVRLYREVNSAGFLKAFSDEPEYITSGISPLKNIMKELHLRTVHIYPRFHEEVKTSLERRRADVVELFQPMTELMSDIHTAIVQCMSTTLNDLKRSNTTIDLDDFNIENAYFRSFDVIVRRQLDPVWNKVGARTKQLISDLSTLRRLLSYLLTYDPLAFHAYLETILSASTSSEAGKQRTNNSPWLLTDAANVIFMCAKRRCYTLSSPINAGVPKPTVQPPAEDDDEAWAALDEVERDQERIEPERGANAVAGPFTKPTVINKAKKGRRPKWLPKGMDPTLEELPKWSLLADILTEIEQEIMRQEMLPRNPLAAPTPGTNTILILTSSPRTAGLISEFLCRMDPSAPQGQRAYKMLERRLRLYLWWKAKLGQREKMAKEAKAQGRAAPAGSGAFHMPQQPKDFAKGKKDGLSEALKKKDAQAREKAASRRRMRGAAPLPGSSRGTPAPGAEDDSVPAPQVPFPRLPAAMDDEVRGTGEMLVEAEDIAEFFATQPDTAMMAADFAGAQLISMDDPDTDFPLIPDAGFGTGMNMDDDYGLLAPSQTILVRSYSDDTDDRLLSELQPRYIVLFEPSLDFVRRIEVYRSSHPGLNVRVYFMVWQLSAEEHKFLAAQRKEKEAFERLIKERGSMLLPIFEDRRRPSGDQLLKTISSRTAGGRRELSDVPTQVIVDMREFRSTLPSLLHAAGHLVIPATLTVGDYILSPSICVERKSIPDLVQSFTSGRLYAQCEVMCAHYKQPVLLIEFEEHKSFSLELVSEMKSYVKPSGKYPAKKGAPTGKGQGEPGASTLSAAQQGLQGKLVLLLLAFPRVRVIWSSSPYASADIFSDLKRGEPEPDPAVAILVGAPNDGGEEGDGAGAGNAAGEELLRTLPGINSKNVGTVMSRVRSVRELCGMSLKEVQDVLGKEEGRMCWGFIHKGEK